MSHGAIIGAVDAEPSATAVLRATLGSADALGMPVRMVSVIEPLPRLFPGRDIAAQPYITAERERIGALHAALRAQVAQLGSGATITFCTIAGNAPARIREAASEWGARLVVIGHGRRALMDRAFGAGVALRVARDAPAPVLVVPDDAPARASCVVALVDFSSASRSAALLAADLAARGATIHLLHAAPEANESLVDVSEWRTVYERGARDLLGAVRLEMLGRRADLNVDLDVMTGHPAQVAMALASAKGAQLIAIGRHAHDLFERMFLGSVSTTVLQTAHCAVLVVPPTTATRDT